VTDSDWLPQLCREHDQPRTLFTSTTAEVKWATSNSGSSGKWSLNQCAVTSLSRVHEDDQLCGNIWMPSEITTFLTITSALFNFILVPTALPGWAGKACCRRDINLQWCNTLYRALHWVNILTRVNRNIHAHIKQFSFYRILTLSLCSAVHDQLEMWANAQRDGHPAKYRWRPLFNATKFGWCPILDCRAVTLPRRETRWYLLGCPKLSDRSQPLVRRSSPYYQDMWRRYCCLTSFFFRLLIHALVAKI